MGSMWSLASSQGRTPFAEHTIDRRNAMTILEDPAPAEYGPIFAFYRGDGKVRGRNQHEAPCTFWAFQLRDGHVIVLTKVRDFGNPWLFDVNAVESVIGTATVWSVSMRDRPFRNGLPPAP